MVIGWLQQELEAGADVGASAWARVEAAQRQKRPACLLVPQPAHAVLAGELAAGLTCFGELPPEITRTIRAGPRATRSRFNGGDPVAPKQAMLFRSSPFPPGKQKRRGRPRSIPWK